MRQQQLAVAAVQGPEHDGACVVARGDHAWWAVREAEDVLPAQNSISASVPRL